MMKTFYTGLILAILAPTVVTAKDNQKKTEKEKPEAKAKTQSSTISTKVVTTVIGPDGKIHTTTTIDELPDSEIIIEELPDIKKIIEEATGSTFEQLGDIPIDQLLKSGSGSITVVGPDGKVTTKKLSETGGLNQIIQEALKGINIEGVTAQVVDVEKPFIQQKGGIRKEINQLRKELAEQRKLLEQILEKLE